MYAPNQACIGCPAISIGMLMYDTSQRLLGNSTSTTPYFYYYDKRDLSAVTDYTDTARKLRQIADRITIGERLKIVQVEQILTKY